MNNVGTCKYEEFHKQTTSELFNQINVNINSQVFISHFLIPRLLARDANKRSAIINLSSVCAYNTSKMLGMYCGTKVFNLHFGNCLAESYSDRIDVLTTTPASTKT